MSSKWLVLGGGVVGGLEACERIEGHGWRVRGPFQRGWPATGVGSTTRIATVGQSIVLPGGQPEGPNNLPTIPVSPSLLERIHSEAFVLNTPTGASSFSLNFRTR